jgi:hypothetical protein
MAQEFVDLPLDRKQSDEAVSISDAVLKKIVLVYSDNTFEVLLPR